MAKTTRLELHNAPITTSAADAIAAVFHPTAEWSREPGIEAVYDFLVYLRQTPAALDFMPDISDTTSDSPALTQWLASVSPQESLRPLLDTHISFRAIVTSNILSPWACHFIQHSFDEQVLFREILVAMQITYDERMWADELMEVARKRAETRATLKKRPDLRPPESCPLHVTYTDVPDKSGSYWGEYRGVHILEVVSPIRVNLNTRNPLKNFYRDDEMNERLYHPKVRERNIKTVGHELSHALHARRVGATRFHPKVALGTIVSQYDETPDMHLLVARFSRSQREERIAKKPTLYNVGVEGFARWQDVQLLIEAITLAKALKDFTRAFYLEQLLMEATKRSPEKEYDPYYEGYLLLTKLSPDGDPDPIFAFIDVLDYAACTAVPMDSEQYTAIMEGRESFPVIPCAESD